MATPCHIIVEDGEHRLQLYRPCYGGARFVLPEIKTALRQAYPELHFTAEGFSEAVAGALVTRSGGKTRLEGEVTAFEAVRWPAVYVYVVTLDETTAEPVVTHYRKVWLGLVDERTIPFRQLPDKSSQWFASNYRCASGQGRRKPMNQYEEALMCLSFLYDRFCQVAETARRKGVSAHVIDAHLQSFEDNFDQLTEIIKDLKSEMEQRLFWQ
jgi:hypothetical protein